MFIATKLKAWALTAWAVFLVLIGAYAWGSRAAKKSAKTKEDYNEALRRAAGAKEVHNAELDANRLPDGGAVDELHRDWMREPGAGTNARSKGDSRDDT